MLLALLLLAPPSTKTIDAAIAANVSLTRGSAQIVRSSGKARATIDLDWQRPNRVLMRYREPGVDKTSYLSGETLIAYDANLREYTRRRALTKGPLSQRLSKGIGSFEYMAQMLIDPEKMRTFFSPYRSRLMAISKTGKNVRLSIGKLSFTFDNRTNRLIGATAPGTTWTIAYRIPRAVTFQPPKGSLQVNTFSPPDEMPVFADKEAATVVAKMVRAYRGYRGGVVMVTSDDEGSVRLVNNGGRFKQSGQGGKWAYDGRTLSYVKSGKAVKEAVKRGDLVDRIARNSLPLDPLMRSFLVRQTPFKELLGSSVKAGVGGVVALNGISCTIVNLERADSRASLFIRPNGFVESVSIDILGSRGEVLNTSRRRYTYAPVNPDETFALR